MSHTHLHTVPYLTRVHTNTHKWSPFLLTCTLHNQFYFCEENHYIIKVYEASALRPNKKEAGYSIRNERYTRICKGYFEFDKEIENKICKYILFISLVLVSTYTLCVYIHIEGRPRMKSYSVNCRLYFIYSIYDLSWTLSGLMCYIVVWIQHLYAQHL